MVWQNENDVMMNQTNGWMGGWSGGGMWIRAVIGVAVVVLLVVVIGKMSKK
jgi:predicted metalloprotease